MRRTVGLLVAIAACGRTPLLPGSAGFADDVSVLDDESGIPDDDDDDDDDDGSLPDVAPQDDTPPDASCGNGVIDPGELCYLPRIGFPSRIDPCAAAIADLDGDGHLDVAVPNSDFDHHEAPDNYASILLGDGAGSLSDPIPFLAGGDYAVGISIGDLDRDGLADLVVANSDAGTINVLRALTPAAFAAPQALAIGEGPVMSAIADIDEDGIPDLAVTNGADDEIRVVLGRGDGTFSGVAAYPIDYPWAVLLVDLDQDGHVDMAGTDTGDDQIIVWHGNGSGAFVRADELDTGKSPQGLVAVQLDGDGWLDLVAANSYGGTLSVWMSTGTAEFEGHEVAIGAGPRSIAEGDFDMNGTIDLAVSDVQWSAVHIVLGDGNGGLALAATYTGHATPSNVRAGDFDEDGVLDLVTSDQDGNEVGLLLSNP